MDNSTDSRAGLIKDSLRNWLTILTDARYVTFLMAEVAVKSRDRSKRRTKR